MDHARRGLWAAAVFLLMLAATPALPADPPAAVDPIAAARAGAPAQRTWRVRGTVTVQQGNLPDDPLVLYIQDETGGISVRAPAKLEAGVHQVVEAEGRIRLAEGVEPEIDATRVAIVGTGPRVAPRPISEAGLASEAFAGRLVSLRGKVAKTSAGQIRDVIYFHDDPDSFRAYVRHRPGEVTSVPSRARPGAEVEVVGVLVPYSRGVYQLRMRGPEDLLLLKEAPLLLPRQAALVASGLTLGAAAALLWIVLLRRTLRRKTEEIKRSFEERLRAESALNASEERYRAFVANSTEGIWRYEVERAVSTSLPVGDQIQELLRSAYLAECNDALARMHGFTRAEEMIGTRIEHWIGDNPASLEDLRTFIQSGYRMMDAESFALDSDGNLRHFLNSSVGIVEDGLLVRAWGVQRDITERRRVEEELRASQKRFEDITFSLGEWVWEVDANGVYTYSSQRGFDLFGPNPGDVIGKKAFDFMPPDEAARMEPIFTAIAARRERLVDVENWNVTQNGERICLLTNGVPILDEAGNLKGYRGVDKDITARKRAEADLARLAAAIEQAAETIVITDEDGTILYANPAFERTTGYTVAEALGKTPRILKSGTQDGAFYRDMWAVLTRGEVWSGRFHNKRKDGTLYIEDATISPVRDHAGRIVNYIAVKLDVTREAELQEQLLQAQKMESIGRLAGGVAHDFNNLLTVINGYSDLILAEEDKDSAVRPRVEEIRSAGARASDLTQQLLAFSRKQIIQPRRLDLNAELRSTQAIFVRLLGEDIEVIHDLAPSLEPVLADPGQMHQVVMNLVVNARDAMPGGGRLLIETRNVELSRDDVAEQQQVPPGPYVRLTVTDSGHGMAPETVTRIFEPFFTTKAVGKGTGLGLSTVYGIVRQNRGMIKVASELGKGTRFIVHLPCAGSERAEEGAREDGAGSSRGSGTVLLVEDDPAVRQLTAEVLRHHGYRVLEADDGQKGADLGEAYAGRIDLLVADVVMPGLTGPQLAGRLNAARPEMKVLYVSGYTDEAIARHGVLEPGLRLLMKPFTPDTLVAIVQELLGTGLA